MYDTENVLEKKGVYMVKMPFEKNKISAADIDKLIDKGAALKEETQKHKKWFNINLRLPKKTVDGIDDAVENGEGLTRTAWIRLAIQRELKRQNSKEEMNS